MLLQKGFETTSIVRRRREGISGQANLGSFWQYFRLDRLIFSNFGVRTYSAKISQNRRVGPGCHIKIRMNQFAKVFAIFSIKTKYTNYKTIDCHWLKLKHMVCQIVSVTIPENVKIEWESLVLSILVQSWRILCTDIKP